MLRQCIATAARLIGGDKTLGWTWFVSGSVARGEAIPGSDVETLIVLDDDVDDVGKAKALSLAADVHAMLERCDLTPDANGVLASRARFCRRRSNWTASIEQWCKSPGEDRGVVMTGLLDDSPGSWTLRTMSCARKQSNPPVVIPLHVGQCCRTPPRFAPTFRRG